MEPRSTSEIIEEKKAFLKDLEYWQTYNSEENWALNECNDQIDQIANSIIKTLQTKMATELCNPNNRKIITVSTKKNLFLASDFYLVTEEKINEKGFYYPEEIDKNRFEQLSPNDLYKIYLVFIKSVIQFFEDKANTLEEECEGYKLKFSATCKEWFANNSPKTTFCKIKLLACLFILSDSYEQDEEVSEFLARDLSIQAKLSATKITTRE